MNIVAELGFNPTMVRLRRNPGHNLQLSRRSFNPTMVRLRLIYPSEQKGQGDRLKFQSHYGAIATKRQLKASSQNVPGFNPTMVRLRPLERASFAFSRTVSIPLWCDCDLSKTHT